MDPLTERLLTEIRDDMKETKELARETNGRVRSLELWRAKAEGAKWAMRWVPALVTGIICSGVGVLLSAAILS